MYIYLCIDRKGGYYNSTLFIQHGVTILEDFLITLADGIASMYLELISVDSSLSNEMNNLGLSLCTLSTRALQRLRNEVLLYLLFLLSFSFLISLLLVSMYVNSFFLSTVSESRMSLYYQNAVAVYVHIFGYV